MQPHGRSIIHSLSPRRIVQLYAAFGLTWILLSDNALAWFAEDVRVFGQLAMLKGVLFILVTSLLIYLLIIRYSREVSRSQHNFKTAQAQAEQEIRNLTNYDRETGLPNQDLLMDRLEQNIALNSREGRRVAVIYISLTSFKVIVDTLGHGGVRDVMQGITGRIKETLRQYDTLARIHRDEFVIVLGGAVKESDISIIMNKLQQAFIMPLPVPNGELAIPACMGVACYPADGLTADILLQNAHIAMNQARQAGVVSQFYSETMNRKTIERFNIEAGMMRAIEDGEFFLCYQPKIGLDISAIVGMEALVRWRKSADEIVPPDRFIPVAEDTGMIVRLGNWVLREACRQNRAWQDAGLPAQCVSVNISARQLRESTFVEQVVQVLEETGLSPASLELELTETAVMSNSDDTVQKLLRLKQMGVSISVDDFGTGYSSLSYLKHLPIDTIKVDRSFVHDLVNDPDDAAIVDAIVAMAHALKLKIVAEGIETREQLEFLTQRRCHAAQGYFFSPPLEAEAYEAFVRRGLDDGSLTVAVPPLPIVEPNPLASSREITIVQEAAPAERIGDISVPIAPAQPSENLTNVLKRFQTDKNLRVLPVVDAGRVVGMLNRSTFLEEHIIGLNGFAFHINHSKKLRELMNHTVLTLEADTPLREAAKMIQARDAAIRIDNVCVTRDRLYQGVVDVDRFIGAITEINLSLAKGANPLTGLPGNESIQQEIDSRLAGSFPFDIIYIDIDNFKPFNDHYGFQKGDVVIKTVGEIMSDVARSTRDGSVFCGHIGGDDFIVISGAHRGQETARKIITAFEQHLPVFHGNEDFTSGCYTTLNRKGVAEMFSLLSLSIGIVDTEMTPVQSYAQLASLSSEVKKAAKMIPSSSIVVNRRQNAFDSYGNQHATPIAAAA